MVNIDFVERIKLPSVQVEICLTAIQLLIIQFAEAEERWKVLAGKVTFIETDIMQYRMLPITMRIDYDGLKILTQVPTQNNSKAN